MQMIELSNAAKPQTDSNETVLRRDVLKLSDIDAVSISDLSAMFGMWKEADHCDKDFR